MANLLTTKELQDLLKIDRTTIYRMLKEGRITGIRVGGQWRFSPDGIDGLAEKAPFVSNQPHPISSDVLPLPCVQSIQQVFAEIAQVGSLTTSPDGEPLTTISNSCAFCDSIIRTEGGQKACVASWRKLAQQSRNQPVFATCHAGLQYARARIEVNNQLIAMVIAGQFYASAPKRLEEQERVDRLSKTYGIDKKELSEAAKELPVLDARRKTQLGGWMQKVADAFEHVAHERAELMARLRSIADMSKLPGQ